MRTIEPDELKKKLADHELWLKDKGGAKADLRHADLSGADLSHADLSSANLSSADLRDTKWLNEELLKTYSFSGFGSGRRMTTVLITKSSTYIFCGCFEGSLPDFETRVCETYREAESHGIEYREMINYIKKLEEKAVLK